MNTLKALQIVRKRRAVRSRARISGSAARPRLAVFRSNSAIYAQLIDDEAGKTVVSASSLALKGKEKIAKSLVASKVGEMLAAKAKAANITEAVFDRRGYKYHGRVKALADGARSGGLKI